MDEREARVFLEGMMSNIGAESGYEVRHQYFVMEMPQSGERIRGREKMREFQAAFGQFGPAMRPRRLLVRRGLWVVEVVSDYDDGQVFNYVSTVESRDSKMWRDTRYYAEPFEAPEWRAQWVERMVEALDCCLHNGTPLLREDLTPWQEDPPVRCECVTIGHSSDEVCRLGDGVGVAGHPLPGVLQVVFEEVSDYASSLLVLTRPRVVVHVLEQPASKLHQGLVDPTRQRNLTL